MLKAEYLCGHKNSPFVLLFLYCIFAYFNHLEAEANSVSADTLSSYYYSPSLPQNLLKNFIWSQYFLLLLPLLTF